MVVQEKPRRPRTHNRRQCGLKLAGASLCHSAIAAFSVVARLDYLSGLSGVKEYSSTAVCSESPPACEPFMRNTQQTCRSFKQAGLITDARSWLQTSPNSGLLKVLGFGMSHVRLVSLRPLDIVNQPRYRAAKARKQQCLRAFVCNNPASLKSAAISPPCPLQGRPRRRRRGRSECRAARRPCSGRRCRGFPARP